MTLHLLTPQDVPCFSILSRDMLQPGPHSGSPWLAAEAEAKPSVYMVTQLCARWRDAR